MARKTLRVHKDKGINLGGRSIEIVVGLEPPVTLSVHEQLICKSSEYFKKAMNRYWKESEQRSIQLEEDDPDTFQLYLHWLYRGTLPVRIDEPGSAGNAEYLQLAKAYVLGEKLQDGDFKDVIIDAIIDKCKSTAADGHSWFPVGSVIRCIYDNTPQSSKARRLLVDLYVYHGAGSWLCDWAKQDDIPREFLFDLSIAFLDGGRRVGVDPIAKSNTCEYHQHGLNPLLCYRNQQKVDKYSLEDAGDE